jgi:hypothetical protein
MFEQTLEPLPLGALRPDPRDDGDAHSELRALLLGPTPLQAELPPLPDLIAAAISLAEGTRHKALLPLGRVPVEFALVRRGMQVLVDCYGTESTPEILLRERAVHLRDLLELCVTSCHAQAQNAVDTLGRDALLGLAARVMQANLRPDAQRALGPMTCTGGSLESPGKNVSLAFGFRAHVPRAHTQREEHSAFADVHALLFEGELWAFCGERKVSLVHGPIMLAAQRMCGCAWAASPSRCVDKSVATCRWPSAPSAMAC